MERVKRAISLLLCFVMVVGLLPMYAFAATADDALTAALTEAREYIDGITVNNASNDPETVVKNFKTHFTWDNEKREGSKSYLFDWSYYNGVVFEGIEYLYEVTGEEQYKDYVVEYMSSLIAADGTWAKCSNNSSKECAGYVDYHGADCYKTASLLLDTYEMTNDSRYLTMAATLYADLDSAAKSYSLSNAGSNYRHTWSSDPTPDLWLDGLYMILPFRAEYAKYIGDQEELDLIVSRMQWVSDNMYDDDSRMFYHAADSASSNSGTFWLRAMGWYAAALADVMDSLEGQNLETVKAQLKKLVDGLLSNTNESVGYMWQNKPSVINLLAENPYETSGTSLVYYAVMKAVNNGWLDESYAHYANTAFAYMVENKLKNGVLTDICFKGAPGSGNETFYDNEGKGVGPFIMLYAEILEYVNREEEPEVTEQTFTVDDKVNIVTITATATDAGAKNVSGEVAAISGLVNEDYLAYEISLENQVADTAMTVAVDLSYGFDEDQLVVYYVDGQGNASEVTGFTASTDAKDFQTITVSDAKVGTYVYGTRYVQPEEDAKLVSIEIVSQPLQTKYFVEAARAETLSLNIAGLEVKATFSDGTEKTLVWNEFGEVDGYALNFDMTVLGDQDVEVSYTYEGVTCTATFPIIIYEKSFTAENAPVVIAPAVPGATSVTVAENTTDETVVKKLTNLVEAFVSYDITLEGYNQGEVVTLSLPVPEGFDTSKLIGISIQEGIVKFIDGVYNTEDNTFTFDVDHFSTQGVGVRAATSNSGTGNLVSIQKVTSLTAGDEIIIGDDNGNYLVRSGTSITSTTDPAQATKWTVSTDGDYYTLSNNGYYLRSRNGNYSYTLNISNSNSNTSYRRWSYNAATGFYYQGYWSINYLRYSNGWSLATEINSGYGAAYEYSGSGEAVTFTVAPASVSIAPDGKANLTGTVTVGGKEVDLEDCTINWASEKPSVATVDNGTVTGVADGTTNIDVTLSAVNDTALQENIVLTIPVTVASKTVVSGVLSGNSPVSTKVNVQPDFSNIKLTVTYDDGTTAIITVDNGLIIDGYSVSAVGSNFATISYEGKEYGTVRVTVAGNPYEGLEDATDYPVYPADGAVRIDKTAKELNFDTTGLVEVELDVAGVSVEAGVDVIMIMDISNSMSWDDVNEEYTDNYDPSNPYERLNIAKASAQAFIEELMKDNGDDSEETVDNSLTMLVFAGIDGDYNTHNTAAANDDVYQLGTDAMLTIDEATAALGNIRKAITGGTNYDYAFQQAYAAAERLHAERGNAVYIVFMTDGVPTHYNGVYYKSRNNTDLTACMQYVDPTTGATSAYTSTGNDRNGNDIDSNAYTTITVYNNDGTVKTENANVQYNKGWSDYVMNNKNGWAEKVKALDYVAHVYAIGFGMKNGSVTQGATDAMPGKGGQYYIPSSVTHATLQHIASDKDSHFEADNQEEMTNLYKSLAGQIKFAGTSAQATDVIDSDFTLQMGNTTGTEGKGIGVVNIAEKGYTPTITIKTYDLWTKAETNDATLIGTRKGTSQAIETVTFNPDGTEAYSNLVENGTVNIMTISNGVVYIDAHYFNYSNLDGVETFRWNIGNITDKEIALSYMAYLKGSLEGEEANGLKYTNEEATLEYIDITGKHATHTFPVPAVAWGGASTAYEFYLVNEAGQPCNRQGDVVPFANRVIISGPFYQDLYLNQGDEEIAQEIVAVKVLPAGYTLYDNTAKYVVQTASGTNEGYLEINDPAEGKVQTTIQVYPEADSTDKSFIQSRVAFGVMYNMIPEDADFILAPDMIVIDYGKSIEIDVNGNNTNIPDNVNVELIGFSKFYDNVDVTQKFKDTPYSTPFEGTYGTFSIAENNKVLYTPHRMLSAPGKIFCVYKITAKNNAEDFYYMVTELYVIPATIVYYETDFATGVFTTAADENEWSTKSSGAAADGPQNDGTIGQNTYGFDTTYENDAQLSNGSSLFVNGEGVNTTTVTFSFTGTGFDLISRTGAAQGLINVKVATNSEMTNVVKSVSVLNKSESDLELYQIPVVSINDLPHSTYYVKIGIEKAYSNTAIPALSRGGEFYFDAIRVYNPAQGNAIAEAAYNADGEANAKLDEVRAQLLSAETYATISGTTTGMVFIDRTQEDVAISTYTTIGPNNEVYLSTNQAVAFKVKAGSTPASFDIGAKSIQNNTAGLQVTIRNEDGSKSWTVTKDIASGTVQFIDLLSAQGADASLLFNNDAYVVITNTGTGVLSITDIKTAFSVNAAAEVDTASVQEANGISVASVMTAQVADPFAVSFTVDGNTLAVAKRVLSSVNEPQEPEVPEEPETPEEPEVDTSVYDILEASVKATGSKKNRKYTITVVTSQEVEDIEVLQGSQELKPTKITYKDKRKDGTRVWTIVLSRGVSERYNSFTLVGIGEDGIQGEAFELAKSR